MAHSHDNGSYASASNSHLHTKVQTAKVCKASWPTHQHQATFPLADDHTHSVSLAFGSAALGSPNWWEHTHPISLVSCGNGGSSHNHTSSLLGAQCVDCPTPADHLHGQGTVAIANTDATHAHTLVAGGVTGYADPAGTPAAHTHTFSITLDIISMHSHAVSGTYASAVCDGGYNHNHASATPTSNSNHGQGVSGSTPSGGESTATAHYVTCTEIFGFLDGKTRVKTTCRTLTEKLGALDTKTRAKTVHRVLIELFGALDARNRAKSVFRTFTELFGASDVKSRAKSIYRTFTELLGASDSKTRVKSIFRTFTEKLGLSDASAKTKVSPAAAKQWGYSVPFSVFRRIGLSGAVIRPQSESVSLKAVILDRKKVAMRALGSALHQAKCWTHVDITRLGRRRRLSLGASTVVPLKTSAKVHGHLLRAQKSSVLLVGKQGFDLVAEVLGLLEATYTYMFVAVTDDKTCDVCMKFDKMIVDGAEIERMFPYATQIDYSLWMVNLHPSCRCMLVLLEIGA